MSVPNRQFKVFFYPPMNREPLLLIFPCNGNAVEALDCLDDRLRLIGFIDDAAEKQGTQVFGYPVFGREALARWPDAQVLAVPGSPTSFRMRQQIIEGLHVSKDRFVRVIHPCARISAHATIGRNVLIMAGVVVTSNARIGDHVCILPNTVLHHDVTVGDLTLIGSNVTIAGGAHIGQNCYIGSGSRLMNGLQIEDEVLIGLGANVIRDVASGSTVAGNPARVIPTALKTC